MRRLLSVSMLLLGISTGVLPSAAQTTSTSPSAGPSQDDLALRSFAALHPIDAHVHVFKTDPAFQSMLERLNLKLLNVLVMDDTLPYRKELRPQIEDARRLVHSSRGHMALCTTFDPYKFDSPTFAADAIKQLDLDFDEGAVAVKIWKNIGMEIKDRNGKFIMADDPKFDPIYKDIATHGKTLFSHQAEPDVAWGPPDPSDPVLVLLPGKSAMVRGQYARVPLKADDSRGTRSCAREQSQTADGGRSPRQHGERSRQHSEALGRIPEVRDRHRRENGIPDDDAPGKSARVPHQVSGSGHLRNRSRFSTVRQCFRRPERLAVYLPTRLEVLGKQ